MAEEDFISNEPDPLWEEAKWKGISLLSAGKAVWNLSKFEEPSICADLGKKQTKASSLENSGVAKYLYLRPQAMFCTDDSRKRFYACSHCGLERITKAAVNSHIDEFHLENEKRKCHKCSFSTFNGDVLTQHEKRCGNNLMKCPKEDCSFSCTKLSDWKRHCNSHTHDKQFSCACGKTFKYKYNMQRHRRACKHDEV